MKKSNVRELALTVRDVACRLQLPERAIRYRLRKGDLRGERGRAGWRIAERDFQAFLQEKANVRAATWRRGLKQG